MRAGPALLIAALLGCARAPLPGSTPLPTPAADFRQITVGDLDGQPRQLATVVGQRPALLSFWAPWCEPCVREQPALQRLSQQAATCGAVVLGIAVGEDRATVAAFARQRGLTFPQLTDQEFRLADALGQRRIPTTVILDREQRVVFTGEALDARAVTAFRTVVDQSGGSAGCPGW